jgi:rootletin
MQLQKSLTNSENERRVFLERLETSQQTLAELRRMNQHLTDQTQRLQTELANSEVQRSGLEAQLRLTSWPPEGAGTSGKDEELMQQLRTSQRERMELRRKVESQSDKVNIVCV